MSSVFVTYTVFVTQLTDIISNLRDEYVIRLQHLEDAPSGIVVLNRIYMPRAYIHSLCSQSRQLL